LVARVCVDGFNLSLKQGSGVATYARNLIGCLADLGFETQILYGPQRILKKPRLLGEVSLFDASPTPSALARFVGALDWIAPPLPRQARAIERTEMVIARQLIAQAPPVDVTWAATDVFHRANRSYATYRGLTPLSLGAGERGTDVMHWTYPLPLSARGVANVYTFHDLVPLRLPFATLDNKQRYHGLCARLVRRADHIVCVSEATRRDLTSIFKVPEQRVTVTYQSADLSRYVEGKSDEEAAGDVAGVFGLDWRGYFLFFGGVEPKKNLPRIVEAYLGSGVARPLVVVGGQGWLNEDELRLMHPDFVEVRAYRDHVFKREDRIRRYEYLPMTLLVSLIRGARATLFPSIYEGFGLPVLESMQLGTPVLTSDAGALPEVAGEAALVVDPYDALAIQRGIRALDADEGLRGDLAQRGLVQAVRFSPENHRRRLAELYAKLV
jgi:glycosyltransferase involved in cell wall biosynthesis